MIDNCPIRTCCYIDKNKAYTTFKSKLSTPTHAVSFCQKGKPRSVSVRKIKNKILNNPNVNVYRHWFGTINHKLDE